MKVEIIMEQWQINGEKGGKNRRKTRDTGGTPQAVNYPVAYSFRAEFNISGPTLCPEVKNYARTRGLGNEYNYNCYVYLLY